MVDSPTFTIIVPTRHEVENIAPLIGRLTAVLPAGSAELLFVDDSDDETPTAIRQADRGSGIRIELLHREPVDRAGGLSGAVVAGMRRARTPWVIVMDGDLQHPAESVPALMARADAGADVVVASRYLDQGSAEGLSGAGRALISRTSNALVGRIFPGHLRTASDPMSGFFAVRLEAIDLDQLRPRGYKILLEILTRSPGLVVDEVPFVFQERSAGDSKASTRQGLQFLHQMVSLKFAASDDVGSSVSRMVGFLAVGLSGIAVNTAVFVILTDYAGLGYRLASVLAAQVAMGWNFVFINRFVLAGSSGALWKRLTRFWALNSALIPLQLLILTSAIEFADLGPAPANVVMLTVVFCLRYSLSARWVFRPSAAPEAIPPGQPAAPVQAPAWAARPTCSTPWERGITRAGVLVAVLSVAYGSTLTRMHADSDRTSWLVLAAVLAIPLVLLFGGHRRGDEIEDHQIDMIVAFFLLGSAFLMAWRWRTGGGGSIDALSSLPLFAAGVVTLLYGVGAIWRARIPLALTAVAASPGGSAIVGTGNSLARLLIALIVVLGLGLAPLYRVIRHQLIRRIHPIRTLIGPAIGSVPFVTTSCLLAIAAGAVAVTL